MHHAEERATCVVIGRISAMRAVRSNNNNSDNAHGADNTNQEGRKNDLRTRENLLRESAYCIDTDIIDNSRRIVSNSNRHRSSVEPPAVERVRAGRSFLARIRASGHLRTH